MHQITTTYLYHLQKAQENPISDWLWENLPVTHKENYLEKRN